MPVRIDVDADAEVIRSSIQPFARFQSGLSTASACRSGTRTAPAGTLGAWPGKLSSRSCARLESAPRTRIHTGLARLPTDQTGTNNPSFEPVWPSASLVRSSGRDDLLSLVVIHQSCHNQSTQQRRRAWTPGLGQAPKGRLVDPSNSRRPARRIANGFVALGRQTSSLMSKATRRISPDLNARKVEMASSESTVRTGFGPTPLPLAAAVHA